MSNLRSLPDPQLQLFFHKYKQCEIARLGDTNQVT